MRINLISVFNPLIADFILRVIKNPNTPEDTGYLKFGKKIRPSKYHNFDNEQSGGGIYSKMGSDKELIEYDIVSGANYSAALADTEKHLNWFNYSIEDEIPILIDNVNKSVDNVVQESFSRLIKELNK